MRSHRRRSHFDPPARRKRGKLSSTLTDHGGSSGQRRLGALVEVVGGRHASVGHLEARVHVDAARHQHAAVGVDGFDAAGHDEVLPDLPAGNNAVDYETKTKYSDNLQLCSYYYIVSGLSENRKVLIKALNKYMNT